MKTCTKCGEVKELGEFNRESKGRLGLRGTCVLCDRARQREARKKRVAAESELPSDHPKECKRCKKVLCIEEFHKGSFNCKSCDAIYAKESRLRNPGRRKLWDREYQRERRKNDLIYRLKGAARCRIADALRRKRFCKSKRTEALIGCTVHEMKGHLESLFVDGMSWENFGEWQIDHIIPLASAATLEEIEQLCHYTNLQPLWASENARKSNKILL